MNPYNIQDLGALKGGYNTFPSSINKNGDIVGETLDKNGNRKAFLWKAKDGLKLLPSLSGFPISSAKEINNYGGIVGYSAPTPTGGVNTQGTFATYWNAGVVKDISQGKNSIGLSINKTGQIAGYVGVYPFPGNNVSFLQACIWSNGVINPLNMLYGIESSIISEGIHITSNGQVFGFSGRFYGASVATKWDTAGKPHDLDLQITISPHHFNSIIRSANDSEVAVGWGEGPNFSNRAKFWAPYGRGNLGTSPTSISSIAHDINTIGQIVGQENDGSGNKAVIWNGPVMTDLNSLIDPGSGWILQFASCLNYKGQIAGIGLYKGESRAWVISPDYGMKVIPPLFWHVIFGRLTDGDGVQILEPSGREPSGGSFAKTLKMLPKEFRPVLKNIIKKQIVIKSKDVGRK